MDIYPIAFVRGSVLFNDGVIGKIEGVGISIGMPECVGSIRNGDTEIAIRSWYRVTTTGQRQ